MNKPVHIVKKITNKPTLTILCLSFCYQTMAPIVVAADSWQSSDRRSKIDRRSSQSLAASTLPDRRSQLNRRTSARMGVSVQVIPSCAITFENGSINTLTRQVDIKCTKNNRFEIVSEMYLTNSLAVNGAQVSQKVETFGNGEMTVLAINF